MDVGIDKDVHIDKENDIIHLYLYIYNKYFATVIEECTYHWVSENKPSRIDTARATTTSSFGLLGDDRVPWGNTRRREVCGEYIVSVSRTHGHMCAWTLFSHSLYSM